MKTLKAASFIAVMSIIAAMGQGCQLDVQGPSMSAKVFYKSENNGDVYKSRGSGMSGGNSYAASGGRMTASGDGGAVYSTSAGRFLSKHVTGNTK